MHSRVPGVSPNSKGQLKMNGFDLELSDLITKWLDREISKDEIISVLELQLMTLREEEEE